MYCVLKLNLEWCLIVCILSYQLFVVLWKILVWTLSYDLPIIQQGFDSIFAVVDRFSKITHFIPCHKMDNTSNIVKLFLRDIVKLHGLPKTIVFDKDPKFISHLWRNFWGRLGTKLKFSTPCPPQMDWQTNFK